MTIHHGQIAKTISQLERIASLFHVIYIENINRGINKLVHTSLSRFYGLPFSLIQGLNVSVVILLRSLDSRLHTPTPSAAPAAMAAPNAVVSGMDGRTIIIELD